MTLIGVKHSVYLTGGSRFCFFVVRKIITKFQIHIDLYGKKC